MVWKNFNIKKRGKNRYNQKLLNSVRKWNNKIVQIQPNHNFAFEVLPAFRSVWGRKFVNMLIQDGKKLTAISIFNKTLALLKKQYPQSSPFLIFFEAVEIGKPAFNAVRRRRGYQSKSIISLLPWWKQYAFVLKWFRHSLYSPKVSVSAENRLVSEVISLRERSVNSKVLQRKFALYQIASEVRLRQHFRWKQKRKNWKFDGQYNKASRWWKRKINVMRYQRSHKSKMSYRVRNRVRTWLAEKPNRQKRLQGRVVWRQALKRFKSV